MRPPMDNVHIKVLFQPDQIASRVKEMGRAIADFYRGSDLTVVVLTNGAMLFAADLVRAIDLPMFVDSLAVSSYQNDVRGPSIAFRSKLKLEPAGRRILIVDEVLDSGMTLRHLTDYMLERNAVDVHTAVMLTKDTVRPPEAVRRADWSGFFAPDLYLVGYGLDSNEYFRNLPFIGFIEKTGV